VTGLEEPAPFNFWPVASWGGGGPFALLIRLLQGRFGVAMTIIDSIKSGLAPVHKEGYRFVAIFAAVTLACHYFGLWPLTCLGVVATAWCAYFFRDPERVTPVGDTLVIAPADGRVSAIAEVIPPPELDLPREAFTRVSIFMNVFDVHVNRSPMAARITKLTYVPGLFLNADLDKASLDNERQALTLLTSGGQHIGVVQIAGLVARRIVKFVSEGESLQPGQRFGLIRFGSRVDVYLPKSVAIRVCLGQRSVAGETVIADLALQGGVAQGRAG
jgi:phosphatidylserine decarboxylase